MSEESISPIPSPESIEPEASEEPLEASAPEEEPSVDPAADPHDSLFDEPLVPPSEPAPVPVSPVEPPEMVATPEPAYDPYASEPAGEEKKKSNTTLIIVLVVVAVLVLCCCLFFIGMVVMGPVIGDVFDEISRELGGVLLYAFA